MKPAPFEYCRPETLDEAVTLLAEFGDDALVMAGGLSLGALLNMRMVRPEVVVDINGLPGLDVIEMVGEEIRTGALARQAEALASPLCMETLPLLISGLAHVGHYQTRSRGTLCGSVAHADPSAETALCLSTLGGEVELTSARGVRRVPADDFILGALATAREADEMVTALYWPTASASMRTAFEEVSERHGDFAIVAAAAWVVPSESEWRYGFGLGGVEDRPLALRGTVRPRRDAVSQTVDEIFDALAHDISPMNDRRASADYRRHLAEHLGKRVLGSVFEGRAI